MSVTTDALMRRWAADDRHEGEIEEPALQHDGRRGGGEADRQSHFMVILPVYPRTPTMPHGSRRPPSPTANAENYSSGIPHAGVGSKVSRNAIIEPFNKEPLGKGQCTCALFLVDNHKNMYPHSKEHSLWIYCINKNASLLR